MPLAIDIGGTFIKYGIVASDGTIVEKHETPTLAHEGREAVIRRVVDCVHLLATTHEGATTVGVGVPGVVHHGVVHSPPNLPGWEKVPLQEILQAELGMDVAVENDANAAALAESSLGAGKQHANFLYVTLGTGVGGGVILDNQLYTGPDGDAGEIGHIIVNSELRAASHELPAFRQGVLEEYVGIQGILRRYGNTEVSSVKEVDERARSGDAHAVDVLEETGYLLGIGLCSALAVLGLRVVVVGGGVSGSDIVLDMARKTLRERAIPTIAANVVVERAHFTHDAGLVGASVLPFRVK